MLLITISMIGVWLVIEANNRTEEFLVAAQPAASGSVITESSFRVVRLNLGESSRLYLKPGDLDEGNYLLNTMAVGQLVSLGSVASAIIDARQPVVITSTMPMPQKVGVGIVDATLWTSGSLSSRKVEFLPLHEHLCWTRK
jgi:flagella basal body P-ring formation protein FlgA